MDVLIDHKTDVNCMEEQSMWGYKKLACLLLGTALLVGLSGCSMLGYWLSGCEEDADLVFYNNSGRVVGSAAIQTDLESQAVSYAKEGFGLGRGESWGFQLPDEEQDVILRVYDQQGCQLAQGRFRWPGRGERLWAVYDGDIALRFQWNQMQTVG